jgi:hypothetical protein
MTDRELDNYLALLGGMLRLRRTQRDHIAGELRDHLIEHVAHLEASGIAHEEAVRRALEEFGDAAALAASFSALVGMRRRRLIMRCTIGTTVVMTGLVVAMLAFRPPVIDDPQVAKAQTDPAGTQRSEATTTAATKTKSLNERLNAVTREKLDILIDADFEQVPLNEVLATFSKRVGNQFYIDPKSLGDAVIAVDTPVTLHLNQLPAEMALELILTPLQCGYTLRNGIIIVQTQARLDQDMETRVYYVPYEAAQELAELIPGSIAANCWEPVGGPGSIRVFRDSLVISQTNQVHQKIEKLLKDVEPVLASRPKAKDAEGSSDAAPVGAERGGYGVVGGRGGYGAVTPAGYGSGSRGTNRGGYGSGR